MGIQGLIPFLEKSSRQVNVSQFSGCTVAIDAYCWLHKGAFGCADKLGRGDKTDAYVHYCMKFVNLLLSHNIKPILVFDGRHLPAKAGTEKKRRENREVNRRRAAELLRQDKSNEARTFLQRCIDVTHTMAVELMRECRSRNVDCITAPYEADAQLAYLNISNIAHIIITEDSDLLLFGCSKVLFKLDMNGNGLLVDQENLHLAMGVSRGCFSMDKFRYMCILSGCDYLPSLPKIGLAKACRFVKSTVDPDIHRALSRLGGHLNMNIVVPLEYRDKFIEADVMFCHQPVYDPLTRKLVPLTPLPPGMPPPPLLAQESLDDQQLFHLALGNLDPFSLKKVDDWTPEKAAMTPVRASGWNGMKAPHKSIWSSEFKPRVLVIEKPDPCQVKRTPTSGQVVEHNVEMPKLSLKRPSLSTEDELKALRSQFGGSPLPLKKPRYSNDDDILELLDKTEETPPKSEVKAECLGSPKKAHLNPFTKSTPPVGNKFSGLSKLAQFKKTSVNETNIVQSRYFGCSQPAKKPEENKSPPETLKDVSNIGAKEPVNNEGRTKVEVPEKLSDNHISSLIQDIDESLQENEEKPNGTIGKENISNIKPQRENSFNWKPSLADMFGFKSKNLLSSPAVKNGFILPLSTVNKEEKTEISENTLNVEGKRTCKKNPFAKVARVEESVYLGYSTGSQSSVLDTDSQSDLSTQSSSFSEEVLSPPSVPSPKAFSIPKPKTKIGLSKNKKNSCQKSLLSMFAFKPKTKLQR